MEPGVREYLIRIVNTIALTALCFILNITAGIKYGWAFIEQNIQWQNLAFYFFFLASLGALLFYIFKIWRKPLNFEE